MNRWVEAARPKTLPASIVPVLVGTAAAQRFIGWRFAAALVVSLALQVAVNYANDYFDAVKGVDTPARAGPRRLTASGVVTHTQMKAAIGVAIAAGGLAGLALAWAVGWELLALGAVSIAALLAYSGGPRPYASAGLGEVFVFVFFGLVATIGSAYVQIERVTLVAVQAALPVGLLATAILVVNNLRDIPTDTAAGKRTLAVRLGPERTRYLYGSLLALAFFAMAPVTAAAASIWPLLVVVAIPFAIAAGRLVASRRDAPGLVLALVATARLHLAFGVLLAVGLWLA